MKIEKIYGVDFSGGKDAGRKIWICECFVNKDNLQVNSCSNAMDFLNCPKDRDACISHLVEFVRKNNSHSLFALDFPFGIAETLVEEQNWEEYILNFPINLDPREWRELLMNKTNRKETKRISDIAIKTPFNSFNVRIYRQTFYGISKFLYPLVKNQCIHVLPMGSNRHKKPKVIEICPASTLKDYAAYFPYKGKKETHMQARKELTSFLLNKKVLLSTDIQSLIINDIEGDGIDCILGAFAAYRHVHNNTLETNFRTYNPLSGYIYV